MCDGLGAVAGVTSGARMTETLSRSCGAPGPVGLRATISVLSGLGVLLAGGCATAPSPPSKPLDACAIFKEQPGWYKATKKAERKWGTPVHVQLAIIQAESSFRHDARPPGRVSSAYGYSQAIDGTWDWYREQPAIHAPSGPISPMPSIRRLVYGCHLPHARDPQIRRLPSVPRLPRGASRIRARNLSEKGLVGARCTPGRRARRRPTARSCARVVADRFTSAGTGARVPEPSIWVTTGVSSCSVPRLVCSSVWSRDSWPPRCRRHGRRPKGLRGRAQHPPDTRVWTISAGTTRR